MTARRDRWITREGILVVVLIAASMLVGWLCWRMVEPFVPALTWAVVLAVIAHPLHERILARVRGPGLAASIAVVLVTLVIAIPTVLLIREVGREAITSADALRNALDGERWKRAVVEIEWLAPIRDWLEHSLDFGGQIAQASGKVAQGMQSAIATGIEWGVTLMITFFLLFYFLRDKQRLLARMQSLMPLAPAEAHQIVHKLREMISAVVYGTLVVAMVQGALGGIIFWWLGLPGPVLWGAVMAVLAVLPMFGAALVWVPAAVLLLLDGHWDKAIILAAWGSLVIGLIDNLLLPMLLKKSLHMHTIPVFIAAVGGLLVFGATGLVLGPVVLALAFALLEVWQRRMALHEIVDGVNDPQPWDPPAQQNTPSGQA